MTRFSELDRRARGLVLGVVTAGAGAASLAVALDPPSGDPRCVLFIGMTVAAGLVKIPMPVVGTFSLAYAFVLATLMGYGLGASTLASLLSALASGIFPAARFRERLHRTCFNAALVSLAALASGAVFLALGGRVGSVVLLRDVLPVAGYTAAFAAINLGLISVAIDWSGEARGASALRANFLWTVPGYLAGSSLAVLLGLLQLGDDLAPLLLAAPFVYLVHLAYRARTQQVEQATEHSLRTAGLYRAVTEALALAIEAKDDNTEKHLNRVRAYSLAIAEMVGLAGPEKEALAAASLLHDIGKIAVPEYILTKPGRLTPDEVERMMAHPRVGSEILSTVPFPYPLAPIVRHHHERWDGEGYPDRLAGEAIPLGARILAVVDCYDALTSDRPYRKALSKAEAVHYLRQQTGRMFDPAIVDLLVSRLDDLEREAGGAQAAVRAATQERGESIAARRQAGVEIGPSKPELQVLHDIANGAGAHLDFRETLALLAARIGVLVPFKSFVIYLLEDDRRCLVGRFATGTAAELLRGHRIPVGDRLSGWVALHQRPYVGRTHVNPLDRDGSRSDFEDLAGDPEVDELCSSLVVPLSTEHEQLGVMALYHDGGFAYTDEQRDILSAVAPPVAHAIRRTRVYGTAGRFGLTDTLTGVPNSRFFFLEAEHRISRAEVGGPGLGIIALRVANLAEVREELGCRAADRMVGQVARRIAAACREGETLVRFGSDLFLILTVDACRESLAARSRVLTGVLEEPSFDLRLGVAQGTRLAVVHAAHPEDGRSADGLLDALERGLATEAPGRRKVIPFPVRVSS